MGAHTPRQGDIVSISLDPQAGHEQAGRRPALVVSRDAFNERTGLAMVCPITSRDRGVALHVRLPADLPVRGFVMTEQVKSVDFRQRNARRIAQAPAAVLDEVRALIHAYLY